MQGARAPALASAGTSGNPWPAGWEGDHTEARAKHPATAATGLHRLFLCFCFLGKSPETHCSCCLAGAFYCALAKSAERAIGLRGGGDTG